MEPTNYLPFIIIPVIVVEAVLLHRDELKNQVKDFKTNILIGFFFGATGFLLNGSLLIALLYMHKLSIFRLSQSWYSWIVIFMILDLVHYLVHYLEHNFRIFWAIHSIHHSSEHFNFSIAIRGPLGTAIYRIIYAAPLCLLGFNPYQVIVVDQIILIYAFFLHTEYVKKLGVLEYFMNTPSHHRVHHSSNEEFLDKNYGACLIIWDRFFGTFQKENSKPMYGLTIPIKDPNPFKIITNEWSRIAKDIRSNHKISVWMNILFNNPGWKANNAMYSRSTQNTELSHSTSLSAAVCAETDRGQGSR